MKGGKKMIKYFLRKFVYKDTNYTPEVRDTLIRLNKRKYVTSIVDKLLLYCLLVLPFFNLTIICVFEDIAPKPITVYVSYGFAFFYLLIWLAIIHLFSNAFRAFFLLITERMYYITCTMHGKALSFKDFRIINGYKKVLQNGYTLYNSISSHLSRGKCLLICLELLGLLKKGKIEFIAVLHLDVKEKAKKKAPFDLHVIYLNNGWVYDTYSGRQYPEEKFFKIWKSIRYKQFSYEDLQGKSVYQFYAEKRSELQAWCKANNCSYFIEVNA